MTDVTKQAEAAAQDIASWLRKECRIFPSVGNIADWAKIISHHEQSAIDEATATLKARIAELKGTFVKQNHDVCQTLGKALRYPWFKDDPANFPDATEANGVCVGDHVPETLAAEAARRIAELEGLGPLIDRYGDLMLATGTTNSSAWEKESNAVRQQIDAILKGTNAACDAVEGV